MTPTEDCDPRLVNSAVNTGFLGGNTHLAAQTYGSYRDAENGGVGDGVISYIDPCPLGSDPWTDANPSGTAQDIGGPRVDTGITGGYDDDNDGVPNSCDPDDASPNYKMDTTTLPSVGSYTSTSNVVEGQFTLVDTDAEITWTVDQFRNWTIVTDFSGIRTITENTACPGTCTITVATAWEGGTQTAPVAYKLIDEQFGNRQDNCPLIANAAQFQSEPLGNITGEPDYPEDGGPRTDDMGDACDPNPNVPDGHYHTEYKIYPFCTTSTTDGSESVLVNDQDLDGWCDADEDTLGSDKTDIESIPEHLYLDLAYGLVRQKVGAAPFVLWADITDISLLVAASPAPTSTSISASGSPFAGLDLTSTTIEIINGTAAGELPKTIVSNTADTINIDAGDPWSPAPVAGDAFLVHSNEGRDDLVSTASDPNQHPETGEPIAGVPMPCSNGYDDDNDGYVDRNDIVPGGANDSPCSLSAGLGYPSPNALVTNGTYGLNALLPDEDADGVETWKEIMRGTDPYSRCPDTAAQNDQLLDPWTLDLNDDGSVDILDIISGGVGLFSAWGANVLTGANSPPWVCS